MNRAPPLSPMCSPPAASGATDADHYGSPMDPDHHRLISGAGVIQTIAISELDP